MTRSTATRLHTAACPPGGPNSATARGHCSRSPGTSAGRRRGGRRGVVPRTQWLRRPSPASLLSARHLPCRRLRNGICARAFCSANVSRSRLGVSRWISGGTVGSTVCCKRQTAPQQEEVARWDEYRALIRPALRTPSCGKRRSLAGPKENPTRTCWARGECLNTVENPRLLLTS